jgi:hypothetical protein
VNITEMTQNRREREIGSPSVDRDTCGAVLVSAVTSFCFRSDLTCTNSAILFEENVGLKKNNKKKRRGG